MKASRPVLARRSAWLLALFGVLALTPRAAGASRASERHAEPAKTTTAGAIELVLIRPGPVDFDALRDALGVRAPGRAIHRFGDPDAPPLRADDDAPRGLFVDIEELTRAELDPDDPDADAPEVAVTVTLRLTMIQSDGRAYERELETPQGDARAVALVLANTLAAIEEEAITPDRVQVTLPAPGSPAPEFDMSIKTHQNRAEEEEAALVVPAPRSPAPAPALPPRLELGLDLSPSFAAVLGPGSIQGLSGGGGELRLSTRFPVGASAALGLRLLTRGVDTVRALRARVTLGGGYVLRLGEVEFAALAGFTVEPWTTLGAPTPTGARDSPPVLLGGLASASVGYRLAPRARPHLRLRVGGRLELSGSALPSGLAVELVDARTDALLLGLGGFELLLGLDVALWFELPSRAR